jgi:thiol:disulfide interchange protein
MNFASVLLSLVVLLQIPGFEPPGLATQPAQAPPQQAFAPPGSAAAHDLADAPFIAGSTLRVSKDKLTIDEPAELIAIIRVQKGHHILDRQPGVDLLIASQLTIEPIPGIDFASEQRQIWPEPHVRDFPGFGQVREQSGEFRIRVPFRISDPEFPSGPVTLRAQFRYQPCTDAGQCFPPEIAQGSVRFTADTPNPPRDTATESAPPEQQTTSGAPPVPAQPVQPETDVTVPRLTAQDWAEHIPWQKWQPGLAEELSRRDHLVYVDFTATWCVTCQTNKQLVLETDAVRSQMRELGVIPLKADFTNRDPVMHREIKNWAPTVPVNLVYAPGQPDVVAQLPAVLTRSAVLRALQDPEGFARRGGVHHNLLFVLLAGFLGGLILNVMPCVLPVISIKILSFVQQAGEDPQRIFRLGLAFGAGIMVWFWAFAALSMTGDLPWQYPQVVIGLSAVLFVFALSLFGVFEIMLPGAAAGKLDALTAREGYSGAFLKGVLATLLGTACTAPFLAGAMAYALTQPAWIVFLVFSAAGLGMASPYVLLSAKPAWLKFIPKPGPWMITFKQAAGFVLLGTVVWLLWILAAQLDAQGVVWTVAFLGFLGLAVWMLGLINPTWPAAGRATVWAASIVVAAFGFYFCYFHMYEWNSRPVASAAADATVAAAATASYGHAAPAEPQPVRKDR